jgi:hypothetical protein
MRSNDAVFDREFEAETNSLAASCIQAFQLLREQMVNGEERFFLLFAVQ